MLFDLANLTYWVFLGVGVFLFLLVILSGGGDDDLELEADGDVDDGFFNFDTEADAEGEFSPVQILGWLGFGKAPLILLLAIDFSVRGVTGWMLNVLLGGITGTIPSQFLGLGGVVLLVSLMISLFIGSLVSRPLGKVFSSFGEDISDERLIGCVGTVTSSKLPTVTEGKIGQVDVYDSARNLVTVSVFVPEWARVIPGRGQQVLIISKQGQGYLAIAKDSSDEDRWLNNNSLKSQ